jgi:hypothetical protein
MGLTVKSKASEHRERYSMKAEQTGRPYREPSHWRLVIKAVSHFFMPGITYTAYQYPQHSTVTPSVLQAIRAILNIKGISNNSHSVTPAQAGVRGFQDIMDSRFRGIDIFRGTLKSVFPWAPWFSEKNITCKNLLFYVLKIFLCTGCIAAS